MANRDLILRGVRQNNLRDIDIDIPLGRAVVVTGPSGSGKSSLAFETIYAEGQRRYMQSLSTYARQFLEKFKAPLAESIRNIPPTIALEQLNPVRNSRATVGTTTELYDYLRLLFEKLGTEHCEKCGVEMERLTMAEIFERISGLFEEKTILIAYATVLPGNGEGVTETLAELMRMGYSRLVIGKELLRTEELTGKKLNGKQIFVPLDRLKLPSKAAAAELETRVSENVRNAMQMGQTVAHILVEKDGQYLTVQDFTSESRCPKCRRTSPPKSATSFSFNSPLGACGTCKGFGNLLQMDEDKVVPNANLTLEQGAIDPLTKPSMSAWQKKLFAFCKEAKVCTWIPFKDLSPANRKLVFEGSGKKFPGVRGIFDELEKDKYKMRIRVFLSRYNSPFQCPECKGARLSAAPLRVKIGKLNIAEVCDSTVSFIRNFLKALPWNPRQKKIAADILRQVERRLDYLESVGLGYLTLSRLSRSLSGGEYQRILLATQLSQGLTDTMYVLDEPSIGLHPKDTKQLLGVLNRLREQGNSLVLVEHDPEVIEWAEHIVDMGPGSGTRGGQIVFAGSREAFFLSDTATSHAVKDWREHCKKEILRNTPERAKDWLEIKGASGNNLKNIDVLVPLRRLVAVTGVSGSGKSTLIVDTLYNALSKIFHATSDKIAKFKAIKGFEHLSGVELVDQSPIGKSSRSNPITFIKGYDEVRALFAATAEAGQRGLSAGSFSFNVAGGRCETCEGEGRVRIDMVFMEDVWVPCQVCDEKRFKLSVLGVRYRGKNIHDVLTMTVDEAHDFFKATPSLRTKFALLQEVGLGYVQLGQPGFTLSGGEAQRLKIARELAGHPLRKPKTLFIFDEPTTGLHFGEVAKLIAVLRRLISSGHSVVVIEHNLQMISSADYVIDLGPDGGEAGGSVVGFGTPKELAHTHLPHTGRYLADIVNSSKL